MTKKRPIIGITPDLVENCEKYNYAAFPWYAIRKNYSDAILKAGGIPLVLPYQHDTIEEIISLIDGVVIPGGDEDIHPKFYCQEYTNDIVVSNDARDEFEMLVLKQALRNNKPILGICRGMQLLNVIYGGSLIRHIPDYIKATNQKVIINHEQPPPKDIVTHAITIAPNTKLAGISQGITDIMVNSTHHQAVDKLGNGLVISATADDGIIEGIESIDKNFIIGVQWHPEYLNDNKIDLNLFESLIKACEAI